MTTTTYTNELDLDGFTVGYETTVETHLARRGSCDVDVNELALDGWDVIDLTDADEFECATGYRVATLDQAREVLSKKEWTKYIERACMRHARRI
jgi:hypothetical protein